MALSIETFITKWAASGAAERANKDSFLRDLCDVLEVPHPDPTTGDSAKDQYVFERDAIFLREGGKNTVCKIDLYKHGCFILEAKQGSDSGARKLGTAKRETPAWNEAMKAAYGQALGYARAFDKPVPFLIVADLGYCFDLYAAFDGSWDYRQFPNAQSSRIFLKDLPLHRELLQKLFLDPHALDPSKHAAKITREIAGHLATLAKRLEADKHAPEAVATFLMRCLFTMFAEDVGLLPEGAFTNALRDYWIPNPASFAPQLEALWRTMNEGGHMFGVASKILKFNGGLFANPTALPLDGPALEALLESAKCNWSDVEPAIFGTLLERALDPKERHRLGAHYTPRAYVERLVKPTIEEPLREDWDLVQAQVRKLVSDAHDAKSEKDANKKTKEAATLVSAFHQKLVGTKVLDPACGTGNFLYVTLDLFKRLEGEVLATLEGLGEKQELLHMGSIRVTPQQFLGIEVKRWAKEIAELVLWIGYLQWHFRIYGKNLPVPEPVLRDYKNIECRDAVLAYDAEEIVRDEVTGKPVTRWDGETMKKSAVTGEDVPDEAAQVALYRYVNPRKAEWPTADFIVGNPPFIGNKRMRAVLGDGYVEALRAAWSDVPGGADYVMYWWHDGAVAVSEARTRRAGLITTNSIRQLNNRGPIDAALQGAHFEFVVPDHPWVSEKDGAAVRVSMTVLEKGEGAGRLVSTRDVPSAELEGVVLLQEQRGTIQADLRVGASVAGSAALTSNAAICFQGVKLVAPRTVDGFIVVASDIADFGGADGKIIKPYLSNRELMQKRATRFVIDFFGFGEQEAQSTHPKAFQRVLDQVKPFRDQNRDAQRRRNYWLFGRSNEAMRAGLRGLRRFIVTPEVSAHRIFTFCDAPLVPDASLYVVCSDAANLLAILSSRVHVTWALAAGGWMGVGNDPRYQNGPCFLPFPFPAETPARVGELAESLDAHRKSRQAAHPELTITGMYNVLEKLRSGEALTAKEKVIHEQGLVSVLKKIHDDLDAAVFEAYGWPQDLTDEQILERLVALNKERSEEEKRGLIRWLRPEFQNPSSKAAPMKQVELATADASEDDEAPEGTAAKVAKKALASWPKKLAEQIAALRDLVTKSSAEWTAEDAAASFKGAKAEDVHEVLESLAALGLLLTYELPEGRRWRASSFISVRPPA